jgi:hypothetical protein
MTQNQFLVAAALWLDEGLGACDREGTITHTETIKSIESVEQGPKIRLDVEQEGSAP